MTKVSFPLLGSISVELNWPVRPVSTRWADLNALDKWPSVECQSRAQICGGSATPSAGFTRLWERNKSNPLIAISPNCPQIQVKVRWDILSNI